MYGRYSEVTRVGERLDGHRLERMVGRNVLKDLGRGKRGSVLSKRDPINIIVFYQTEVYWNRPRRIPIARCVAFGNTCRR